jgi:hypothetical protein
MEDNLFEVVPIQVQRRTACRFRKSPHPGSQAKLSCHAATRICVRMEQVPRDSRSVDFNPHAKAAKNCSPATGRREYSSRGTSSTLRASPGHHLFGRPVKIAASRFLDVASGMSTFGEPVVQIDVWTLVESWHGEGFRSCGGEPARFPLTPPAAGVRCRSRGGRG